MSRIARVGVVVGIVVLVAAVGGVAADEHPEHEHPDELEESGDQEAILQWYSDRMGEIHINCAEGFTIREFDACEDLDDRYESLLEPYVELEQETTESDDEQVADEFNETRQQQAELAALLEEFNETRQEYETAREAGEETRVRELVRELQRLAARIDELGGELAVRFITLNSATGANLEQAATSVNETRDEVITITTAAERDTFEPTELTARTDGSASIVQPGTISGTLRAENGSVISGGKIVLTDSAGYRETATTSADGTYTVPYAPVDASPGVTEVTARYTPSDRSTYLGTTATATTVVEAVPARLRLTSVSESAAFGNPVNVSGVVSAEGIIVSDVPVQVSVGGTALASGRTGEDGQFELSGALPATVPSGEAELTVRGGAADTALEPDRLSETLRVESTATELSAAATNQDTETVRIEGTLTTSDGTAVPDQPVTITLADETATATTTANGDYSASIAQPPAEATATVSYANPDSNLEASEATVTVSPSTSGGAGSDNPTGIGANTNGVSSTIVDFITNNVVAVTAASLLGIIIVVGTVVTLRRRPWESQSDEDDETTATAAAGDEDDGEDEPLEDTEVASTEQPPASPEMQALSEAETALETEPTRAAQFAYLAVRAAVDDDIDPAQTHWELYNDLSDDEDSNRANTLRTVVEAFEMATFAPDGIDRTTATNAVTAANEWCSRADTPAAGQPVASDGGDGNSDDNDTPTADG